MITDTELFSIFLEIMKWGIIIGILYALWSAIMNR